MRARKVKKNLGKIKKIAAYVSTIATIGIIITQVVSRMRS